jgi:hypothetical protein
MLNKWMELWTTHPNHSDGAGMREWYENDVETIYERWRIDELDRLAAFLRHCIMSIIYLLEPGQMR